MAKIQFGNAGGTPEDDPLGEEISRQFEALVRTVKEEQQQLERVVRYEKDLNVLLDATIQQFTALNQQIATSTRLLRQQTQQVATGSVLSNRQAVGPDVTVTVQRFGQLNREVDLLTRLFREQAKGLQAERGIALFDRIAKNLSNEIRSSSGGIGSQAARPVSNIPSTMDVGSPFASVNRYIPTSAKQEEKQTDSLLSKALSAIGYKTDAQKEKQREEEEKQRNSVTGRLRLATNDASESLLRFSREMAGMPSTLTGLIKMSVGGQQDHGIMSTLQKSLMLAILPLGQLFVPAIAWASKRLQDFGEAIGRATGGPLGKLGAGLKAVGLEKSGEGLSKIDWLLYGKEKAELGIKHTEALLKGATLERYNRVRSGKQQWEMYQAAGGTKESLLSGEDFGIWNKIQKDEKSKAAWRAAVEADRKEALKQQAIAGFEKGGISGIFGALGIGGGQEAGDKGGKGGGKGGGKRYASDVLPPGYQAQYSEIGSLREQMQVAAFSMTELDMRMWQEQNKLLQQMLDEMQGGNDKPPEKPPR